MGKQKRTWKKTAVYALMGAMVLQSSFLGAAGTAFAEEEIELQELLELTSPEFETGEESAATARLKIGDWLDYGDYGIERTDIPGTTYLFYITTKDENEEVINDQTLAYCIQSYFLTPLPGDHTIDMTDHVLTVNGGQTVHKALYYGYAGAGYDAAEFDAFLQEADPAYYNDVYVYLADHEKEELAYILTHAAASYAYYTDGTDFERFLELQFEIKYGEDWEENLGYFIRADVAKAEAAVGDLNLFGSTYGMNDTGIKLAKAWYDVLAAKKAPDLSVTVEENVYTFNGNEKNEELSLAFTVPEGWECTVTGADGAQDVAAAGETVTVYPADSFVFVYAEEAVAVEQGQFEHASADVDGTLTGAENEIWSLVVLETNKGTNATVSKRQQDIATVSRIDAGKTELNFAVEAQVNAVEISVTDHAGNGIPNAVFGVYYDEACTMPVELDGAALELTADVAGKAYLEYVVNDQIAENGGGLYVKQIGTITGYLVDESVYNTKDVQDIAVQNILEGTGLAGSVSFKAPEGTELPESVTVKLMQNGEEIDAQTVGEAEGWSYEWNELPKYDVETAAEYEYSVEAEPIEGYETTVDGTDIVNTIAGTTDLEGQIVWYDGDDADGLRPESITVELSRGDEVIDSVEASAENDWIYEFTELDLYSEDGNEVYEYSIGIQNPEEYVITMEEGQITATHTASAEAVIELVVDLAGRALREGDFVFELVQVTDASGAEAVEGGVTASAVNGADGKVAFEGIQITEPGTYYYKITGKAADENGAVQADPIEYVAQVEAAAGGENGDQIETVTEFVDADGNPVDPAALSIEASYHAAGSVEIDPINISAESGVVEAGQYEVQLLDEDGNVIQTQTNDADGKVTFDAFEYTQDDIGNEYTYTVKIVDPSGEAEEQEYQITVKVEDSESGDGTLQITCETPAIEFTVPGAETEAPTEEVTEAVTEAATEEVTAADTEEKTEKVSETEAEAAEASAEAEEEENSNSVVITFVIALIILIILYVLKKIRKTK